MTATLAAQGKVWVAPPGAQRLSATHLSSVAERGLVVKHARFLSPALLVAKLAVGAAEERHPVVERGAEVVEVVEATAHTMRHQ